MALIVLALLFIVLAGESGQHRVAARRRGGARARVQRQAAGVARGAAGARASCAYLGAARDAPRRACCASRRRGAVYVVGCARLADRDAARARRTIAPGRSARPTAAHGTRRSCSTAPTGSAGNPPNRASSSMKPGPPLPDGDAVRARPHPDRAAIADAPARAVGPLSGERLGLELLVALLLGLSRRSWLLRARAAARRACAARGGG